MAQFETLTNSKGETLEPLATIADTALFRVKGQSRFFITGVETKSNKGKEENRLNEVAAGWSNGAAVSSWENAGKYHFMTEQEARTIFYKQAIPFEVPENPTSQVLQETIDNYLTTELKLPTYDKRHGEQFAKWFSDLHSIFIKKQ